ncbi:MAG: four-carbon acid sugar kinase family protein [Acetivibrionales bacterium]|jgi:uncharacterized protein YgbK (DUF1537 family)
MSGLSIDILKEFPSIRPELAQKTLSKVFAGFDKKIVVLDDDPTGTQTVHDVSVFTDWNEDAFMEGFCQDFPLFFILTNSRSFSAEKTKAVHKLIGERICCVSKKTGKDYVLISRSDSTLRGHFPLETEILRKTIESCSEKRFDGEILVPFFLEGGRYTLNNIHYVREGDYLIPAADTDYARDKTFGFHSSHLGDYIQEKTRDAYKKDSCIYISLKDLRAVNMKHIIQQLLQADSFSKIIVNAVDYQDLQVFSAALVQAMNMNKTFLIRGAASIVRVMGNIPPRPLLQPDMLITDSQNVGGIIIVGSHVHKTNMQLEALSNSKLPLEWLEFNQHLILQDGNLTNETKRVTSLADRLIESGKSVVIYTRRERIDLPGGDEQAQLDLATKISDALIGVISNLRIKPRFIIAKGGITSSDIATKALKIKKATVLGQIQPGIPVWLTGVESKFPQMPYIIFPGNVGENDTLVKIVSGLV